MALELVRDTLKFDQIVGEGQSQTLLDRDVIVPDVKPDIARILSMEGKINITGKNVEQDRIAVEGAVNFSILYSANDEPQPIYSMSHTDNFSQYINIAGAMPGMEAQVRGDFEHIDFNTINGRKFNLQCVVNLKGKVRDRIPVDVAKDAVGISDVQLLKDNVTLDEVIGESTDQAIVRGTIQIPEGYPAAGEILKYRAMIHKKDVSIEDGRVVITGSVLVPVLLSARSDEDKVDLYRLDDDLVFTHTMEMPGVMPDMACSVDYNVDDVYAEISEDDNNEMRHIDIEVVVGLKAKVTQKVEFPVVIDLYAPSKRIEAEKLDVAMDLYFGRNTSQAVIKESLNLPGDYPGMDKIYDMVCKPSVTECKIVEDKVVVEGVLGFDLIYLVKDERKLVHSFSDELPFKATVPMPGCRIDMKPDVYVDIENIDINIIKKNEIEVKATLGCLAEVYEKVKKSFIVKADEKEEEVPIHKASITIYMVQPKDTLWKIAKRYFTTVENIMEVNDIPDSENLQPGMKLIIPKKL